MNNKIDCGVEFLTALTLYSAINTQLDELDDQLGQLAVKIRDELDSICTPYPNIDVQILALHITDSFERVKKLEEEFEQINGKKEQLLSTQAADADIVKLYQQLCRANEAGNINYVFQYMKNKLRDKN